MGILRALWDHQASDTDSRLILHIPDFSLVQSLRARPASFSSEVTEWLHVTVQMMLSPSVAMVSTGPTPLVQGAYTSADLDTHLPSATNRPLASLVHPSGAGDRTCPGCHLLHSRTGGFFSDWSPS